jgi:hypothetical protein
MKELMSTGWSFKFFGNKLDTCTCIAKKGNFKITCDNFEWWALVNDIVAKCDKYEEQTRK